MYSHDAAAFIYPEHYRRTRWANREGWKYQTSDPRSRFHRLRRG